MDKKMLVKETGEILTTPNNGFEIKHMSFSFEFDFKINEVSKNSGERGTILSINPSYFVLHYYNENLRKVSKKS